jgi:hypothetical protein
MKPNVKKLKDIAKNLGELLQQEGHSSHAMLLYNIAECYGDSAFSVTCYGDSAFNSTSLPRSVTVTVHLTQPPYPAARCYGDRKRKRPVFQQCGLWEMVRCAQVRGVDWVHCH